MKIGKAPAAELLKKAVTVFKMKAEVLHTRLLVLAALRRRMALVGAVSRRIHALVVSVSSTDGGRENKQAARVDEYGGNKALALQHKHRAIIAASRRNKDLAADRERDDAVVIDLSELAMFREVDDDHDSFPDCWTHSLFDDDDNCCYGYDDGDARRDVGCDGYGVLDVLNETSSVIDIIRSNREGEGLEFNMDEEIDEACDMFIRRFRNRMN